MRVSLKIATMVRCLFFPPSVDGKLFSLSKKKNLKLDRGVWLFNLFLPNTEQLNFNS